MKADTGRSSFDPVKHYRDIIRQQGRVDLESDANEQSAIAHHLRTTTAGDIIGPAGGPAVGAAFGLTAAGTDLTLSAGRYYVGGTLLENEGPVSVWNQPDLPAGIARVRLDDGTDVPGPNPKPGRYLVYLDVWDLHRTALEDGAIREVALGGPDTTTRIKTVWQAKLLLLGAVGDPINCTTVTPQWTALTAETTGSLAARAEPDPADTGPCVVPAGAGFRGLENQHYRVEIHKSGGDSAATFKWAQDNGSTVASWVSGPDAQGVITVASPGRDSVSGFAPGMWVELIDDTRELAGKPGTLVQLKNAVGERLTLPTPTGITFADYPVKPRVRRWDSQGELPTKRPGTNQGWVEIKDGVQVRFAASPVAYRTGDYWNVPARSAIADVLWPRDTADTPRALPPHGIRHRFARLGLVSFDGTKWTDLHDCRELFPDVTQLTELRAVAGDGQTVLPATGGAGTLVLLPQPIVVGVSNGSLPVIGAGVRFTVTDGTGTINGAGTPQIVHTDTRGLASALWRVDSATDVQQVRVDLLDDANQPFGIPVGFTASLLTAARTAYTPTSACPNLARTNTVQQAIDILCQQNAVDLPKIKGISWDHAGFLDRGTFIDNGLRIGFDRGIKPPEGSPLGWFLVTVEYDRRDFEGDPNEIFVRRINASDIDFTPDQLSVIFKPFESFAAWVDATPRLPNEVLCRVVLKSHVLLDGEGHALDGDFLAATLPTGDGTPGGDFESWFTLVLRGR